MSAATAGMFDALGCAAVSLLRMVMGLLVGAGVVGELILLTARGA